MQRTMIALATEKTPSHDRNQVLLDFVSQKGRDSSPRARLSHNTAAQQATVPRFLLVDTGRRDFRFAGRCAPLPSVGDNGRRRFAAAGGDVWSEKRERSLSSSPSDGSSAAEAHERSPLFQPSPLLFTKSGSLSPFICAYENELDRGRNKRLLRSAGECVADMDALAELDVGGGREANHGGRYSRAKPRERKLAAAAAASDIGLLPPLPLPLPPSGSCLHGAAAASAAAAAS